MLSAYSIPSEQLQQIINYLGTRPYAEVAKMMSDLAAMIQAGNAASGKAAVEGAAA